MTILYFTSTGNCLAVAKKIGGRLCSIPQMNKTKEYTFSDDSIGIICPVYGLCIPPYVQEFIKKAQFNCSYLFGIITYGFIDGAVCKQMEALGKEKEKSFDYLNTLKMAENYLPQFEMGKEIRKWSGEKGKKEQEEKLNQILADINSKKTSIHHDTYLDQLLTKAHEKSYAYNCGIGMTKHYHVEEGCKGCGICTKVCPMHNIQIVNGKPVFGESCISCLACTQNCPQNAIRLTNEKSRKRYRNASVSLQELIGANQ